MGPILANEIGEKAVGTWASGKDFLPNKKERTAQGQILFESSISPSRPWTWCRAVRCVAYGSLFRPMR